MGPLPALKGDDAHSGRWWRYGTDRPKFCSPPATPLRSTSGRADAFSQSCFDANRFSAANLKLTNSPKSSSKNDECPQPPRTPAACYWCQSLRVYFLFESAWLVHRRLTNGPIRRYLGTRSPIGHPRPSTTPCLPRNCVWPARNCSNWCWPSIRPGGWRRPTPCSIAIFGTTATRPSLSRRLLLHCRAAAQWPILPVPTRPSTCPAVATMILVIRRPTASYLNPTTDCGFFSFVFFFNYYYFSGGRGDGFVSNFFFFFFNPKYQATTQCKLFILKNNNNSSK